MSSDKANKSLSVTPPVAGVNTIVRAGTASAERILIPDEWTGWLTIQADGVRAYVAFGGAAVAASIAGASTLTAGAITAHNAGECQMIPEDGSISVNLEEVQRPAGGALHLSHIEASAAGYIRIIRSSGKTAVA